MTSIRPTAREALVEASDFARDVWRDCWPVMSVIVVARTLVFLGHHVSATEWAPGFWPRLGELMTLAYIPLFGALYRLGVGGRALDSLGWGGFQWTGVEWRLLGVWIVLGFALAVCATPLAIVPLLYLFKHHAAVSLGPLGSWSLASILLAPFWLAFAGFVLFMGGRLGLAAALTTARGKVSPFASWSLTRGLGWTIGAAWLVTQLPMIAGWVGLWAMGLAEAGDLSTGPAEIWPLADAAIAGAVVAILAAVIQVPLSVGLLSGLYRWLAPEEALAGDDRPVYPEAASVDPALETPPEPTPPDPVPEGPPQALSAWPHTVLPRTRRKPRLEEPIIEAEPPADPYLHPLPEASEAGPPAEPPVVESAHPESPPPDHLDGHVAEPPLATALEPDQITGSHDLGNGPEPHG
jgi:hypothetical protein